MFIHTKDASVLVFIASSCISILLIFILSASFNDALSQQDPHTGKDEESAAEPARGILPQLGVLLQVPEGLVLYDPETPVAPEEPIEYERVFPIMAEEVINNGYKLPLPIGISIIGVHNTQGQDVTDVNVALGKGVYPPENEPLRSVPAVKVDSISVTQSLQIKADLWVLPFLNIFATLGKVTGDADLTLIIDRADAPTICVPSPIPTRPPICTPNTFTGTFLLPVKPNIDRTSATLGVTGTYSIGRWYTALTASYTDTSGDKASDIKTTNASVRAGRRLFFKSGTLLSPFFGINYLDIDTRVQGITSLADAFPDGDSINVRYDIQLENDDKYAGVIGLTAGFTNGTSIVFEWNKSANSERYVFSGTVRY